MHCRVEKLGIGGNVQIGEDHALYNILSHSSSRLLQLYMWETNLSTTAAIALFNELIKGNKLQDLGISCNDITDGACDIIAFALKETTSLVKLLLWDNKISAEATQ